MKVFVLGAIVLMFAGCEDRVERRYGPGVLIYHTGVTTTCREIELIFRSNGDVYRCYQDDGVFDARYRDVSSVKRLTKMDAR